MRGSGSLTGSRNNASLSCGILYLRCFLSARVFTIYSLMRTAGSGTSHTRTGEERRKKSYLVTRARFACSLRRSAALGESLLWAHSMYTLNASRISPTWSAIAAPPANQPERANGPVCQSISFLSLFQLHVLRRFCLLRGKGEARRVKRNDRLFAIRPGAYA